MLYALCTALALALLGLDQWVKHYVTVHKVLADLGCSVWLTLAIRN